MISLLGKKVLVAGGGGFLGSHICDELLGKGMEVTVLDVKPEQDLTNLNHIKSGMRFIQGSVVDENLLARALKGMDAVVDASFPAAGCNRDLNNQHVDVGTTGVFNLLKYSTWQGARFIYCSSISVYGIQQFTPIDESHPVDPFLLYGATKLAGEIYCRAIARSYGGKVVILRFSDIFGPRNGRSSAPEKFLRNAMRGAPLLITGDGQQVRSYLYAVDAARSVACALEHFKPGGVYNITGKEAVSIIDLADTVKKVTGAGVPVKFEGNVERDLRNYVIDGTRAAEEINFTAKYDLVRGLRDTLAWIKKGTMQ